MGTVSELAADMRVSRTVALAAIDRLEKLALIEVADPFGKNRPGLVVINVYDRLVPPNKVVPAGGRHVTDTRPTRHGYVTNTEPICHESDDGTPADQPFRDSRKEQGASKEEGERASHSLEDRPAMGLLRRTFPGAKEVG